MNKKCMGSDIQNAKFKHDFEEVKGCGKRGCPCTAHLDGLNRDILRHNEGIWQNTHHCLYRRHFGPRPTWQLILASLQASLHAHTPPSPYTAPGMHHTMKLWYGVNNLSEVGSTVVYPPSLDLLQLCMFGFTSTLYGFTSTLHNRSHG